MSDRGVWEGTATDLLAELNALRDEVDQRRRERLKSWPKSARSLSNALRRLAPNLRQAGIQVQFDRKASSRRIEIEKMCNPASSASPSTENPCQDSDSDDDTNPEMVTQTPFAVDVA